MQGTTVCWPAKKISALDQAYHDTEWGRPLRDERRLFEMLILEGMQAGLSWSTILNKREGFRRAFDGFDPERMAAYGEGKIEALMQDASIIRNRRKIEAAIQNAKCYFDIVRDCGSLERYLWDYVDGQPIVHRRRSLDEIPATSPLSERISADLRARGFAFVGPTILYAYMQAVGLVDDHLVTCPCHTLNR